MEHGDGEKEIDQKSKEVSKQGAAVKRAKERRELEKKFVAIYTTTGPWARIPVQWDRFPRQVGIRRFGA